MARPGKGREGKGSEGITKPIVRSSHTHTDRRPVCNKQQQRDGSCFDNTESTGQHMAERPKGRASSPPQHHPEQEFSYRLSLFLRKAAQRGRSGQDKAGVSTARESFYSLISFFEPCSLSYMQDRCYRTSCKNEKRKEHSSSIE